MTGVAGDNPDDLTHTIGEIVISPDAHPRPFFLGDAIHANDLSSLFAEGAIPQPGRDGDNRGNDVCEGDRAGR